MIVSQADLETERDGAVLIIRLANEASRNTLSRAMRFSLRDAIRQVEDDRSIRAVCLTGKGSTFCAGGDLNMMVNAHAPWEVHRRMRHASTIFQPLLSLDRPVVCGVRGHAVGGGLGLALMADVLIAGDDAQFMAGFFRLGVVPDCLTLYTLPRLIGLAKARRFFMTNGVWSAAEAVELGLAHAVVPPEEVEAEALRMAHRLAEGPVEAIGLAKQVLLKAFESSVDDLMLYEDLAQSLAMSSVEFAEGLAALRARRKADFPGAVNAAPWSDGIPGPEAA